MTKLAAQVAKKQRRLIAAIGKAEKSAKRLQKEIEAARDASLGWPAGSHWVAYQHTRHADLAIYPIREMLTTALESAKNPPMKGEEE